MNPLIMISGKQLSGKDLFTDFLLELLPGYIKMPIAKAIKEEFAALYGLTPHEVEAKKEIYRLGLITLGQRRRQQDQNYWLKRILAVPAPKIISDVRLQYEYDVLRGQDAFCIRLEADRSVRAKRGTIVAENDPTECELDTIQNWDAVILNNGSIEEFKQQAKDLVKALNEPARVQPGSRGQYHPHQE
jgi:phosphomevalonate kinase